MGREIRSLKLEAGSWKGEQKIKINTSELNDGIYILKLDAKDFTANRKIVVKH
jgi:hypothetical protein